MTLKRQRLDHGVLFGNPLIWGWRDGSARDRSGQLTSTYDNSAGASRLRFRFCAAGSVGPDILLPRSTCSSGMALPRRDLSNKQGGCLRT